MKTLLEVITEHKAESNLIQKWMNIGRSIGAKWIRDGSYKTLLAIPFKPIIKDELTEDKNTYILLDKGAKLIADENGILDTSDNTKKIQRLSFQEALSAAKSFQVFYVPVSTEQVV